MNVTASSDGSLSPAGSSPARTIIHLAVLAALCGVLFLFRASTLPLADPEESRYALIVREMMRSGNWIIPHLDGQPYYDKPAPFFWLAAAVTKLTGSGELGGRGLAALGGLVAVLVTYAVGRRLGGPTAGLVAGVVLATSGEFFALARWYRMDMPFVAALWAAIGCFWKYCGPEPPLSPAAARRGWLGFYALCAVATLFKGPVALVLAVLIAGGYLLLAGGPRRVLELFNWRGIVLYLLLAAPWFILAGIVDAHYFREFFWGQNVERFATKRFGHSLPGVIYVVFLLAGLLPWTVYLPGIFGRLFPWRWRRRLERPEVLLLWLAALIPLVFFALAGTKMVNYILPSFPPLAVLIGLLIAEWIAAGREDRLMAAGVWAILVIILVLPVAMVIAAVMIRSVNAWVIAALPISVALALAAMRCFRRLRLGWVMGLIMAAVAANYLSAIGGLAPAVYDRLSTRDLAMIGPLRAAAGRSILCFYTAERFSLTYYAGAKSAERFGATNCRGLEALATLMAEDKDVFCLVSGQARWDELVHASPHLDLKVLARREPLPFFETQALWLVTNAGASSTRPASRPAASRP
jgi:4-amino-4-deoxy-L-arabinose transferase-like glycosyltransferase